MYIFIPTPCYILPVFSFAITAKMKMMDSLSVKGVRKKPAFPRSSIRRPGCEESGGLWVFSRGGLVKTIRGIGVLAYD